MADYVDGVKIAELPEASSISDTNILVTEDSDATKQVTADKLKDYTNAELLQRVTDLESQITQLNQSLTELEGNLGGIKIYCGSLGTGSRTYEFTSFSFLAIFSGTSNYAMYGARSNSSNIIPLIQEGTSLSATTDGESITITNGASTTSRFIAFIQ